MAPRRSIARRPRARVVASGAGGEVMAPQGIRARAAQGKTSSGARAFSRV
jgi:hypothetical protein